MMISTYKDMILWMDEHLSKKVKPGLERVEYLLEKLGHPEEKLRIIHIAGTNGKGSTVQFLKSVLLEHKKNVGTFTSPYFYKWNEQIEINGVPISDEDLIGYFLDVQSIIMEMKSLEMGVPSEFELMSVIAFLYFARSDLDFCIIEAGLGGKNDSTNVVSPLVTIITNVGLDHTNILGNTIKKIATEKAGIMKQKVPLVTAAEQQEALAVFDKRAHQLKTPLYQLDKDFFVEQQDTNHFTFKRGEMVHKNFTISLIGNHQIKNASLAIQTYILLVEKGLITSDEKALRQGLQRALWPGRLEVIKECPLVLLDGAHNVQGISALLQYLEDVYSNKKKHLIFSVMKDKATTKMIDKLDKYFETIYFTSFPFDRAETPNRLFEISNHHSKHQSDNWVEAYNKLLEKINCKEDMIIFAGSLYFIFYVRKSLL